MKNKLTFLNPSFFHINTTLQKRRYQMYQLSSAFSKSSELTEKDPFSKDKHISADTVLSAV